MEIISHAANIKKGSGVVSESKIKKALDSPCDIIEVDLNLTKDNKFVCIHDPIIKGKKISTLSLSEIKKYEKEALSINEVYDLVKERKTLLLDVKDYVDTEKIKDMLIPLLKEFNPDNYIIESFDISLLEEVKKHFSESKIIILARIFTSLKDLIKKELFYDCLGIGLSSEHFFKPYGYKKYREYMLPEQKLYAWTWTLLYKETEELFHRFKNCQCDGIIADEVMKLERTLNK